MAKSKSVLQRQEERKNRKKAGKQTKTKQAKVPGRKVK